MRLGCGGCLGGLLGVVLMAAVLVAPVWLGYRMLQSPIEPIPTPTATEGLRAQQKLYQVAAGPGTGRAARDGAVVLTEGEVTAFLSNHLAPTADLPFSVVVARFIARGDAEIAVELPLRQLLSEGPLGSFRDALPTAWLARPVWLKLRGDFVVEPRATAGARRALRFDVEMFWIGRQRVPAMLLRLLLHPGALRVLRWPLPDRVDAVVVEPGRLIIRTGDGR
jgi:hypothetical protein